MKKEKILRLITAILVVAIFYATAFSFFISIWLGLFLVLAILFVVGVSLVYYVFLEGVFKDKEDKETNNDEKQIIQNMQ